MRKVAKILTAICLTVLIILPCIVPVHASWLYPDGGSVYEYITTRTDDYNRTIYVYHRDTSGNLLKYCEYYTGVLGDYYVCGDYLYGYDIVAFESNQGIGEKCVLTPLAENGGKGGYGQIGYEFYSLISKSSLTVNLTYRKQEATTFNIKHYTVAKDGTKTLYDSSTETYSYGDMMDIRRKYPTGFSLREGYLSTITGSFTYDVLDVGANVESRLYVERIYDPHQGEIYYRNSFEWTNKDWIDYCINRQINVTFLYDINKYAIQFDANGGSGAPADMNKYHDEDVVLPTTTPTRNGYTFKGWGTTSTDDTPNYQPGGTYTTNTARTLYAIWESNIPTTYTVSYNANGGSGAPASQTKTKDVSLTLSSTKPTRNGYTFQGWSTSSTATSVDYSAGGSYTENASVTLYAVWKKNSTTYTISYNANGGTGAPASQTKTFGYALSLSSTKPTRSGYSFLGWSTSSTATEATYSAGGSYTPNASATLYAVWKKNTATYTISYHANGGTGAPASQTKTHGVTLSLSAAKPTRTGYTFLGWSTSRTATSAAYSAGGSYTENTSATLYAVWQSNSSSSTPSTTYTITYNANGGSGAPAAQTKVKDEPLTLSSATPYRSGYTFLGWNIIGSASTPSYRAGDLYTANAPANFYAIWSEDPDTYTVSYDANGGSGAPNAQAKTENVTLTLSTAMPYRSGYSFLGWSTNSSASSPTYYAGGSYTENASATLYAVWSKDLSSYTVSYDANGGSGAPAAQTKVEGVALTLSSTTPYRSGYAFLGWSTSSTASSPAYYAGGNYTDNASATLYAVWEKNAVSTYTVRYNANGGSGAPSAQTKTEDVTLTLSSVTPTRSGYDFVGWSTSSTATSATYSPGSSYTANASATLYAVWKERNYDFSISDLTISNSAPNKYDSITVKVKTDSWDQVNAYTNIPVQLYYGGQLVSTQNVNFTVYGAANVTFTLNVGNSVGDKTIEIRVNWADHLSETRTGNNTVTQTICVKDNDHEISIDPATVEGTYYEGMDVITSFVVSNDSDNDIIPTMHNTARFVAYYYNGSQKIIISTQDWNDVVIPAGGKNLVYFKWKVPEGLGGQTVYLECTANADGSVNETDLTNNTVSTSTVISKYENSQTPDTRFESSTPDSYQKVNAPEENAQKASWTMWAYENGEFMLKKYGVQISSTSPIVIPSSECASATYEDGRWTMRSGYGISISYEPTIVAANGCLLPDFSAYTSVQHVVSTFPEFRYMNTPGDYRTLEYTNGEYQFVKNSDADSNARVHFVPLYVRDGEYIVSITAMQVWTPAGMIEATRNANVIVIDGTIYDDWYQG